MRRRHLQNPGCHFRICNAKKGAPNSGFRSKQRSDRDLKDFGLSRLQIEPSAFSITKDPTYFRLLCFTEDSLVAGMSPTLLY